MSQKSSIGIETGYGLDGRCSILSRDKILFSTQCPAWLWGTPGLLSNVYRGLKRPRLEDDQSPLFTAEVKKGGTIHPLPHTSSRHGALAI
jgi:hypothetical protein